MKRNPMILSEYACRSVEFYPVYIQALMEGEQKKRWITLPPTNVTCRPNRFSVQTIFKSAAKSGVSRASPFSHTKMRTDRTKRTRRTRRFEIR